MNKADMPPKGWCTSNNYSMLKIWLCSTMRAKNVVASRSDSAVQCKANKKVAMHTAQTLLRLACNVHFAVIDNLEGIKY
eukprot:2401770-Ditylum_brightwellii.AAC.1